MFLLFMKAEMPFQYDFCVARLTTYMYLGIHIGRVHEEKKPFNCAICDFGSATATNLEMEKTRFFCS